MIFIIGLLIDIALITALLVGASKTDMPFGIRATLIPLILAVTAVIGHAIRIQRKVSADRNQEMIVCGYTYGDTKKFFYKVYDTNGEPPIAKILTVGEWTEVNNLREAKRIARKNGYPMQIYPDPYMPDAAGRRIAL